ncbi:MAG TPA: hypothetical protein VEV21_16470, partial [Burkholderiales bacterium]|nr:hypothetical protein [Burkholderiales bacterium]
MAVKMAHPFHIALIYLLCVGAAWSQSSSPSSMVVFASIREPASGTTLVKRADYVSFAVTVTSSESDFVSRVRLLGEARNVVTGALAKQGVRFETGPTYLSLDQPSSSSTFSSGLGYNRPNEAVVNVLVPVAKSGDDLFDASSRVASNLAKIQLPARTSLRYSSFRLAVENPERYRKGLITKIAEEVTTMKAAMHS